MINQFFESVVCLTQEKKPQRTKAFMAESERVGFTAELFYSLDGDNAVDSFNKSQIGILRQFVESGKETVLVLEDDAVFTNIDILPHAMAELPEKWGMLYLGINAKPYDGCPEPMFHSTHLRRVFCGYTTHAVAYQRDKAIDILDKWNNAVIYDVFLSCNILPDGGALVTCPFVSVQQPTNSDLWGGDVDYTAIFKESETWLKRIQ